MTSVAVMGTGAMGSRMARALLEAGHRVTVWNRDPSRTASLASAGAAVAASPRAAAAEAELAIAMVRDDVASRQVWLAAGTGALAGLGETAIAVDSSTLSVGWSRELAEHCRGAGRAFLEAPVAGSRPQADAAQLIHFVGGDADVLARAEDLLRVMGKTVHHTGPAGSAARVKLAVNALLAVQLATMAELIGFLRHGGLDPARAVEIVTSTPVCSPAVKAAAAGMLARDFAPQFPVELVAKDLGYALAGADGALPVTEVTRGVFVRAMDQGLGPRNATSVAQLYG